MKKDVIKGDKLSAAEPHIKMPPIGVTVRIPITLRALTPA